MRSILIILFFMLTFLSAKSQSGKWLPGYFTDVKGNKETGLIRIDPSDHGPLKGEGFIEFKQDKKAKKFSLSASDLKSFVIGRDSFVVAHPPTGEIWAYNELDFVRVVLDEDIKLYEAYGAAGGDSSDSRPRSGFSIGIGGGIGTGGGGFGVGVGGGVEIPLGGGGGGYYNGAVYYYGENTAQMKRLTNFNFADVMTDIMGDEPDVVNQIATKNYTLENINKLIAYFKQVQASRKQ